jgi:hypothetical protein
MFVSPTTGNFTLSGATVTAKNTGVIVPNIRDVAGVNYLTNPDRGGAPEVS